MTCDHKWANIDVFFDEESETHLQRCLRCGARRTIVLDGERNAHVYGEVVE